MKKSRRIGAFCGHYLYSLYAYHRPMLPRDLDGNLSTAEAYYDANLNITWLADANFAQTSGYSSYGFMTWAEANTWANGLNIRCYGLTAAEYEHYRRHNHR